MPEESSASSDVRVGLFVLSSLLLLGAIIFLLNDEGSRFVSQQEMRAAFRDVKGLTEGSPVRMGGVDVGTVEGIGYSSDPQDGLVHVTMRVTPDAAKRIREDSVAEVADRGLLGDKMIVISAGSPSRPVVAAGARISTKETRDVEQVVAHLKSTLARAERVMGHLETTTQAMADESFQRDVKKAAAHLSLIAQSLNEGDGYAARLLNDGEEAERISETVGSLRKSASDLSATLQPDARERSQPARRSGLTEPGGASLLDRDRLDSEKENF